MLIIKYYHKNNRRTILLLYSFKSFDNIINVYLLWYDGDFTIMTHFIGISTIN